MEISDQSIQDVTEQLYQERAIDFRDYKPSTLRRRIKRRVDATHCEQIANYLELLTAHPEEYADLIDSLLINVTEFFRDSEAWGVIKQEVIPRILAEKRKGDIIKVWSAGCATGEEAYTLAMLFDQALKGRKRDNEIRIYATDIDENALSIARRGAYSDKAMESVPAEMRDGYFSNNESWMVSRELRKMVIFGRHNLVNDAPISHCDLIICRNVLIYMSVKLQNQLLSKFHYALESPGFMFLGKAEAMLTLSRLFSPLNAKVRVFAKESPGGAASPAAADQQALGVAVDAGLAEYEIISLFNEAVLRHAPVGVLAINGNSVVRLMNPAAERIWGVRSSDLLGKSLVEVPLPPALQGLVQRALQVRQDKREFIIEEMMIEAERGRDTHVSVRMTPMFDVRGNPGGVIILAEDITIATNLKRDLESTNEELNAINEEMETTNEELQSTNEELVTTNEELQSTNEELETTNEELQSTNEELETTNDELEARTQELNGMKEELETQNGELESVNAALVAESAERAAAEQLLEKYRMLSGNSRDIILFVRTDGRFVEANEAAISAYDYTRDELLALAIYDLRAPEERDTVAAQMATADERGILFETVHYRKDGSSFPVEVSSRGAQIGDQRLLLSVIRDITERRAAEEALARAYDREHRIAGVLQEALIPPSSGKFGDIAYDVRYQAAWEEAEVGGDFCEAALLSGELAMLAVGDVSGKGLEAAVEGSMAKNMLLGFATETPEPGQLLARLNEALCAHGMRERFITLAYMLIDLKTHTVRFGSAGHEPVLHLASSSGEVVELGATGQALGFAPGAVYDHTEVELAAGDILFIYTDGISEAGHHTAMLGAEGLANLLREHSRKSLRKIQDAIYKTSSRMSGGKLTDDATSALIRLEGK